MNLFTRSASPRRNTLPRSLFAALSSAILAVAVFVGTALAAVFLLSVGHAALTTPATAQTDPFAGSAFDPNGGAAQRPRRPVVPARPQYNQRPQQPPQYPAGRTPNYQQNAPNYNPNVSPNYNPNQNRNPYPNNSVRTQGNYGGNAGNVAPANTGNRGRYSTLPERRDPYASRSGTQGSVASAPAVPSTYSPSAPIGGQRISLPDGDELLRQVQQRLPRDHLIFPGVVRGTTKSGQRVSVPVEIDLNWAAAQPTATYTLLDNRGLPTLAMRVVWVPNQQPIIEFRSGSSLTLVPDVRITDKILDLELTWSDLALSFIWWRNGRTLGGGIKKLNRRCFLVEVPAPHWESRLYNKAQLWIDDNERMVVQGQTFTAAGRPLRYFEVDEIAQWKKDHWMAKKLEFTTASATKCTSTSM